MRAPATDDVTTPAQPKAIKVGRWLRVKATVDRGVGQRGRPFVWFGGASWHLTAALARKLASWLHDYACWASGFERSAESLED